MLESNPTVVVLESLRPGGDSSALTPGAPRPLPSLLARGLKLLSSVIPALLAWMASAGLFFFGYQHDWRVPKFSALVGARQAEPDDWCSEHSVPESTCVACKKKTPPPGKAHDYCRTHGVSECPSCHPELAQVNPTPVVTAADKERGESALAFAPRPENNIRCMLHERRIQFANTEVLARLGIAVASARFGAVQETITTNGEIGFDARAVARLSARVPGILWRIQKQVGEQARKGEILALVDAAEVGKSKAAFQQALGQLHLKTQVLVTLSQSTGIVPGRSLQEAEAHLAEAQVNVLTTRQTLINLGFAIRLEEYQSLAPAEVVQRMQFLGLSDDEVRLLAKETASSNLLPVRAPFDGEVIERKGTADEAVDPNKVLFVIADTRRMWLTLHARIEDARRIQPGQQVRFRHDGHEEVDTGTVVWVSPAVDEKTRTVPVRVAWPNSQSRHHANTFGTARVILRQESQAVVVPSSAVHWEGDCHVVFVRDKDFATSAAKVFHVRKVRPGASDPAVNGPYTEIAAGLLPGELVATTNSGILRSELLKNNLGEG